MLLHAAVPEQLGGARESLWGAPAGPGYGPDAPPPQPAPLGRLSGLREAAAAGLNPSFTNYYPCAQQPQKKGNIYFQMRHLQLN